MSGVLYFVFPANFFVFHITVILPVIHICPQSFPTISSVCGLMVNQCLTLMSESFFMSLSLREWRGRA